MVGFGFSDRPEGVKYSLDTWADQTVGVMDALGIEKTNLVGNSFGGSIALRIATKHPDRINKLVLMGSMGVHFEITPGLDKVWGYDGTFEDMRLVMDHFAYSRALVNDELAKVRYEASNQPGFQESFSSMFPAPAAALGRRDVDTGGGHQGAAASHPDRARPGGQGHPAGDLAQAHGVAGQRRSVGVLALRALVDDRTDRRLQPARPRLLPRQYETPVLTGDDE